MTTKFEFGALGFLVENFRNKYFIVSQIPVGFRNTIIINAQGGITLGENFLGVFSMEEEISLNFIFFFFFFFFFFRPQ